MLLEILLPTSADVCNMQLQHCIVKRIVQIDSCTPAASCTGVRLRALSFLEAALAAWPYLGSSKTCQMADAKAGVSMWAGSTCSPKPCVGSTRGFESALHAIS